MQRVTLGDIGAAADWLARRPPSLRAECAACLVARARLADRFRRRHGRCAPGLGNGTLMAAALSQGALRPASVPEAAFLSAVATIVAALQAPGGKGRKMAYVGCQCLDEVPHGQEESPHRAARPGLAAHP